MKNYPLLWSLLITLFIFFGSMNTASARKCHYCQDCNTDDLGTEFECKTANSVCARRYPPGGKVFRLCVANIPKNKLGCNTEDEPGPPGSGPMSVKTCYCDADFCNREGARDPNARGEPGSGSIPLGQMSLWLFFTLSTIVPWTCSTLFANGHTSN